ncbi:MAG: TolC family protein [Labilithrix sp.]|nr:TolC family protein [Labilithrix sp.]
MFGLLIARLAGPLALVSFVTSARAESFAPETPEAAPRAMTLEQASDHARANHARLAAARLRLAGARRDADVPGAQWLPYVSGFGQMVGATTNNSTATQLANPNVDIPRVGATEIASTPRFQPYPSTMIALGARQQLYDFGRVAAETAAASLAIAVETSRVAGVELDVGLFVEQAFYAVLAAEAVERAARGAYERAVAHHDLARANERAGLRPPIESTRAEADVARYEAGAMRARGAVHVARAVFAAAAAVDDLELGAAGDPPETSTLPSLVELLRRAEISPLVREARARVLAQQGETRRIEAQTRPRLYATGSINGRAGGSPPNVGPLPPGDGWVPIVPNYDLGVVLSWPIVDPSWSRRADASREREHAAQADSALAMRDVRAAITVAWHEASITLLALPALERGAEAAAANYEHAEKRFRVGLGTSTEVADAQALRTEADIQLAIGRFQKARARATLARAAAEVR